MNIEDAAYVFDLQGHLVVPGALNGAEVEELNRLIDLHALDSEASRLSHRYHYRAPLEQHQALRDLIDHGSVAPYLAAWVGGGCLSRRLGYRLDHAYFIFQDRGEAGLSMHLGGTPHIPSCSYHVHNGKIFSGLTVVSYVLNEVPEGQGGFACIPGSHKSAFPYSAKLASISPQPLVATPSVRPGDAVIFTEALTHGSLGWQGDHRRRALFYKYAPAHSAWSRPHWSEELLAQVSAKQRQLLEPPYIADERDFFA